MTPHRIAVVGGGPWGTYALERLAAELPVRRLPRPVHIVVFERTGSFGAGAAHDAGQPVTSYLNRVASQLSFAADESNHKARNLLPAHLRPTFAQWCRRRFERTGDRRFDVHPQEVPHRYLHGIALGEQFNRYVELLVGLGGVTVDVRAEEVVDLEPEPDGDGFVVHTGAGHVRADHVLLVTGQSENAAAPGSSAERLARHAEAYPPARYVPTPYPLGDRITTRTVPPGCRVGVLGLGLTSVDLILHLTEGRGGTFRPGPGGELTYHRTGREPGAIVAVSPSGMFPWSRPWNAKAADDTGSGHAALEHHPAFLTTDAVTTLREHLGVPVQMSIGTVRQLDFERHVFPLIVLEMAYTYYSTLFGGTVRAELGALLHDRYRDFCTSGHGSRDEAVAHLLAPMDGWFDETAARVARRMAVGDHDDPVTAAFRRTVFGDDPGTQSPWGHPADVRQHRFVWTDLFDPLSGAARAEDGDWHTAVVAHMRRDQAAAAQGNLRNPVKAACDGVWRDLRPVLSAVLDFGGLTAGSYRRFVDVYLRHYTRMSNGTGVEPMRKVLALLEAGVLDLSVGPGPVVQPVPDAPAFTIFGSRTGTVREVDVVVEGRGHPFDPVHDRRPLFRNLIRRGLVRQWAIPDPAGEDVVPGPLDVTREFHPFGSDGRVDDRLTVLGAPTERMVFFQLAAARPHCDSTVVNLLARWANDVLDDLEQRSAGQDRNLTSTVSEGAA
jgi:uncharacterized NAD(P)/FAD-binding protein YdhS